MKQSSQSDTRTGNTANTTSPRQATIPWWLFVWGLNTLVLAAAFAVKSGWTGNKYVRKLAPNWEYTFGNWWSAALLLCFGCLAASIAMHSIRGARVRWAMGCLSVLATALSLDELGSFHERVAEFGPFHLAWNLLPFAVIFIAFAGLSLWWLKQDVGSGKAWIKLLLGLIFLGMGEPIDMIEKVYPWPAGLVPLGVILEEGVELLGSTLLIWGAIHVLRTRQKLNLWPNRDAFIGLVWLGRFLLIIAAPILVIRHGVMSNEMLGLSKRGDFGAAPVSMMFLLATWACGCRSRWSREARGLWATTGIAAALVSIEIGCNLYAWITRESVRSDTSAWWVQVSLILLGYGLLNLACRDVTPVKPRSQEVAA